MVGSISKENSGAEIWSTASGPTDSAASSPRPSAASSPRPVAEEVVEHARSLALFPASSGEGVERVCADMNQLKDLLNVKLQTTKVTAYEGLLNEQINREIQKVDGVLAQQFTDGLKKSKFSSCVDVLTALEKRAEQKYPGLHAKLTNNPEAFIGTSIGFNAAYIERMKIAYDKNPNNPKAWKEYVITTLWLDAMDTKIASQKAQKEEMERRGEEYLEGLFGNPPDIYSSDEG